MIKGEKGKKAPAPYVPVEDENSLRSNSVARIVDIISEGEIEGFVDVDSDKSIYINEIPLKGDAGYNFEGITTAFREGLPSQDYIPGFTDSAQSEQAVGTKLFYNVPVTKNITDSNVDEVVVSLRIPTLVSYATNGDIRKTSVVFKIEINSNLIGTYTIYGKCISEYLRSYRLPELSGYGSGPWEIKLTRLTADSSSSSLVNDLYWNTYTEHINEKIRYSDTAIIGFKADAQQFGGKMPSRLYHIKGLKVHYPSNYNPITRAYTGVWDGTFTVGYTNNPAWVYYDLLYSERYGCGFEKDIGTGDYYIDKWELYTIAQNCDVMVDDGFSGTEPRFTFNTVITTRVQAQIIFVSLASTFRAKPFWSTGYTSLAQDRPKDPSKIVCNADVVDGLFNYSGSSLKDRITCVNVSWNDPDDFYKPAVEVVSDQDGIALYGFNTIDIAAYGCTSRGQAQRFGKYYLHTELQQTTTVEYVASFDHYQLIPGDVIIINDDHFITKKLGGRIKSATTSQVVIDRSVELESGKTYTIAMESPAGALVRADITNSPETTDTLSISAIGADDVPQDWSVFSINSDSFDERQFQIVSMKFKEDNIVAIKALLYDADKYAAVDEGVYFDEKHYSDIATGPLGPPTNLDAEEYTYTDGQNNLFGVILSWSHPDDSRVNRYEIQSKLSTGAWYNEGQTEQNYYDIKPIDGGEYQFRVRSQSISGFSEWVTTSAFTVYADPDALSAVSTLQVVGGGTVFNGKNCEIEWGWTFEDRFKEFVIEVCKIDDTLLRTESTTQKSFIYTYDMNVEDNTTPIRSILFKVYVRDVYDKLSDSANLTAENPIPSMAGTTPTLTNLFKGLKIDWSNITPSDNDLEKYKIYLDKSNPPTTEIAEVGYSTTQWIEVELESASTYYCKIEPFDYFGAGEKSEAGNGEPLILPGDGIDVELTSTIDMSDSDSNTEETLAKLYDGNKVSDGIGYTLSGTDKWIEYKFPIEYIMDNVTCWMADANANIYIGYKRGESDSWHYLKAEADHSLDADGRMLDASNLADAQTNYLDTTAGINRALFPQALVATHCRLFYIGTYSTTIYELRFIREVIAEQIIADNLSSISANVGAIAAGTLQSQNYDNSNGMLFDLNGDVIKVGGNTSPKLHWDGAASTLNIKAVVTFESASTGYSNISDKPTTLGGINSTEGTKLTGIDNYATHNETFFQDAEPTSGESTEGDIWIDTNDDNQLYHYDGTDWQPGKSGTGIPGQDGEDGDSINWLGSFSDYPVSPNHLDAFYHTVNKKSYVYDTSWYQMTSDGEAGQEGTSIEWKGSLSTPPANPELNWAYYDTDDGKSYIYDGAAWELLTEDGLDGVDGDTGATGDTGAAGEDGTDGTSTFTYYQTSTPGSPATNELWYNPDTELLKRWSGSAWQEVGTVGAPEWQHGSDTTKVDGGKVYTDSIDTAQLAADCITATQINAGEVDTEHLAADAVEANKINVTNLAAINSDLGAITAGSLTVNSSGFIKSTGKDSYSDTTAGYWIGYDSTAYKLNIGNASNYLKWTGSALDFSGELSGQISGNFPISFDIGEHSTNSTTWAGNLTDFIVGRSGVFKVSYSYKTSGGYTSYFRIRKNGVAYGTEKSTTSEYWVTYTQDLSFAVEDTIELWFRCDGGGVGRAYTKNFIIYCGNPVQTLMKPNI